ncbi:hypothetical protein ACLOAV_003262 [Pseudogymnoascus australis]
MADETIDNAVERRRQQNREAQRKRRNAVKAQIQELQAFKDTTLRAATQSPAASSPSALQYSAYNNAAYQYSMHPHQDSLPHATSNRARIPTHRKRNSVFQGFEDEDFINEIMDKGIDIEDAMSKEKMRACHHGARNGIEALSPTTILSPLTTGHEADRCEASDRLSFTSSGAEQSLTSTSGEATGGDLSMLSMHPSTSFEDVSPLQSTNQDQKVTTGYTLVKRKASYQDKRQGALKMAVLHGQVSMVSLLLEHGVNINIQDKTGRTALHDAAEANDVRMVELLLQNGADLSYVDYCGMTALEISASAGNLEVAEVLLRSADMG